MHQPVHLFASLKSTKLREWPLDWDLHILNTFSLYFLDREPNNLNYNTGTSTFSTSLQDTEEDIRGNMEQQSVELKVIINSCEGSYISIFKKHLEYISTLVFRIEAFMEADDPIEGAEIIEEMSVFSIFDKNIIAKPIGSSSCLEAYELATSVEEIINQDYVELPP